ncbi:hypothetical protein GQ55_7G215500 [Panicum hallii var. hallii]|uniref:Uncharacterized protein n=1 Tax=Panicum hallii var. hallii TaxID=1504633 RepID=A0A2T7CXV4_9POAL|nr:hypothetical protein GQ55_7G215500 [Panicum hallii var. hallii]
MCAACAEVSSEGAEASSEVAGWATRRRWLQGQRRRAARCVANRQLLDRTRQISPRRARPPPTPKRATSAPTDSMHARIESSRGSQQPHMPPTPRGLVPSRPHRARAVRSEAAAASEGVPSAGLLPAAVPRTSSGVKKSRRGGHELSGMGAVSATTRRWVGSGRIGREVASSSPAFLCAAAAAGQQQGGWAPARGLRDRIQL